MKVILISLFLTSISFANDGAGGAGDLLVESTISDEGLVLASLEQESRDAIDALKKKLQNGQILLASVGPDRKSDPADAGDLLLAGTESVLNPLILRFAGLNESFTAYSLSNLIQVDARFETLELQLMGEGQGRVVSYDGRGVELGSALEVYEVILADGRPIFIAPTENFIIYVDIRNETLNGQISGEEEGVFVKDDSGSVGFLEKYLPKVISL